ncbi:MAG: hypothetical protein SGCHY_003565 [Lobulomycetales sp.]
MSVKLFVYDLSQGMARTLSLQLTGRQIDAIYHTSVVAFGMETYFGQGILQESPGSTMHGRPIQVIDMGDTHKSLAEFQQFIQQQRAVWRAESYHLLDNNCNNFSDAVCMYLVGKNIPSHITGLPQDFLNTPLGAAIRPVIENIFGPSRHSPAGETSAVGTAAIHTHQSPNPTTLRPLPMATPMLDSLPGPCLFESFGKLDSVFEKFQQHFRENSLSLNDSIFQDIKTCLSASLLHKKPLGPLPKGWNLVFEQAFSKVTPSLFPVLDVLRLLLLHQEPASFFGSSELEYQESTIVSLFSKLLGSMHVFQNLETWNPVVLMSLRIACNAFARDANPVILSSDASLGAVTYRSLTTCLAIESLLASENQVKLQHASTALIYNLTLFIADRRREGENGDLFLEWVAEVFAACAQGLRYNSDPKLLYAVGLILKHFWQEEAITGLADVLEVNSILAQKREEGCGRVAEEIQKILSA